MRRQSRPPICNVEVIRPTPKLFGPIEGIDGDAVRMNGTVYRLAGFDTPERSDLARCDDERRRAEAAPRASICLRRDELSAASPVVRCTLAVEFDGRAATSGSG